MSEASIDNVCTALTNASMHLDQAKGQIPAMLHNLRERWSPPDQFDAVTQLYNQAQSLKATCEALNEQMRRLRCGGPPLKPPVAKAG